MKRLLSNFTTLTPFRIAMVLTLLVLAADLTEPKFLQTVELKALDAKFITRGIQKPSDQVAIIAIDEKSIKEMGRWPWPRWTHANLIEKLNRAGAKAVGFDIVFAEADQNSELTKMRELVALYENSGLGSTPDFAKAMPVEYAALATAAAKPFATAQDRFFKYLVESEKKADSDKYLGEVLKEHGENVVLGYYFYAPQGGACGTQGADSEEDAEAKRLAERIQPSQVSLVSASGEGIDRTICMASVEPNIEVLSSASEHAGHFYMLPDPEDGVIRWNHMVLKYQDSYFPSLGLKTASVALDQPIMLKFFEGNVEEIRLGDIRIPTNEKGSLLINYAGPLAVGNSESLTFKIYSFTDILNDRIPVGELKDKIFVVGPTAVGIYDLRNTPFDTVYPGVGIHANVISNILEQNFLQKPAWMKLFDITVILLLGLGLGVALGKMKGIQGAMLAGTLGVGYLIFTQFAFVEWGIWLSTLYPVLGIGSIFAAIVTFKYMTEERQAKQIRGAFANYVTPSVVDQVLREPDRLKLGGDTRVLTVMFSDVRGFTTISESLTAEQLVDLLNAYLSKMTDLVFQSDGTLDKYIGDALMAIWGAPVEQPDHAIRACFTAIDMLDVLEKELRPQWEREGLKHIPAGQIPFVDIGIGLNSGEMVVGNMGSDQRFDYTVMGDNVNLGSRLEGTNKSYGTHIIISESTRQLAGDLIVVRELDLIRVKGKNEPVRIYELVGKAGQVPADILERNRMFEEGLAYYRKREWDLAERTWRELLGKFPADETTEIFLDRLADNRDADLPETWDGVYVMKTK